jgi:hypothetical protein
MTVSEAMDKGLTMIRRSEWQPKAYAELLKLDDGSYGPWATIKEAWIKERDPGADYPQVLVYQLGKDNGWEEYTGPYLA